MKHVISFDGRDKELFLRKAEIDKGIRPLCDAINSIEDLVTMNSCQGKLFKDEEFDHCPITYVDFYALHDNYYIADGLCKLLMHRFGSKLMCHLEFEADFNIMIDEEGDEYVEDNGLLKYRYRVEMVKVNEWQDESSIETMNKVVETVKEYGNCVRL